MSDPIELLTQCFAKNAIANHEIREIKDYRIRSHNEAKAVVDLINYLYVKYPVPAFLYETVMTHRGMELLYDKPMPNGTNSLAPVYPNRVSWFVAAAQGASFVHAAKGSLSRKEAHWFLLAPEYLSLEQAELWAKLKAHDLEGPEVEFLMGHLTLRIVRLLGGKFGDLIRFHKTYSQQMKPWERSPLTAFLVTIARDPQFSFKGRTLDSVRKLCQDWQRAGTYKPPVVFVSWTPQYRYWDGKVKNYRITSVELTTSRELALEAAIQKHCVLGYVDHCVRGRSRIFSVKFLALGSDPSDYGQVLSRLTVEVNPLTGRVTQVRGNGNRDPYPYEKEGILRWASECCLTVEGRVWQII